MWHARWLCPGQREVRKLLDAAYSHAPRERRTGGVAREQAAHGGERDAGDGPAGLRRADDLQEGRQVAQRLHLRPVCAPI